jgi:periplasmic divalent cation tolerance protein
MYVEEGKVTKAILVITTLDDADRAQTLAGQLVGAGLAACVNILPAATSVYRWQDEIRHEAEHVLLIKTRAALYDRVEEAIRAQHPYELPEIIAAPITMGSSDYLNWIDDSTVSTS